MEENSRLRVLIVLSTLPEAVKMAPLIRKLYQYDEIKTIVGVISEPNQMLYPLLDQFQIRPDYDFNIMSTGQSLLSMTQRVKDEVSKIIENENPDIVLVHGDSAITFASTQAAFYNKTTIGHVGAGIRTYSKYSPYPEVMYRQLIGALADLHFAPTTAAANHLLMENKKETSITITGNTIVDAFKTTVIKDYYHPILEWIGSRKMILLTTSRTENLDVSMKAIFSAIRSLIEKHSDIVLVYPLDMNPDVRRLAEEMLAEHDRIRLTEPLNILDFHNFMARSYLIVTDSPEIQEEAPSLGIFALCDTAERPELAASGTMQVVGTHADTIFPAIDELLINQSAYMAQSTASNPFGDGDASRRICEAILYHFGMRKDRPLPFLYKSAL